MSYIRKEDVIKRCEFIKKLGEDVVLEWQGHTEDYKEQHNVSDAFARMREMRDMIRFIESLPVAEIAVSPKGQWVWDEEREYECHCSNCKSVVSEKASRKMHFCPYCGADMRYR